MNETLAAQTTKLEDLSSVNEQLSTQIYQDRSQQTKLEEIQIKLAEEMSQRQSL